MKQIVGIMTRTVLLVVWGMMAVACERGDGIDSADPLVAVAVHTRAGETDGDRLSPTLQQGIVFAYNADGILEGCATFDATSTMVAFKLREGKKTFVVVGNPREELKKKLVRQVGAASEETPGTIAETGDETVTSWTSPYRYEKLKGVVVGSDDLDYIRTSGQVLLWGETCTDVRQSTSASDTPLKVEVKNISGGFPSGTVCTVCRSSADERCCHHRSKAGGCADVRVAERQQECGSKEGQFGMFHAR